MGQVAGCAGLAAVLLAGLAAAGEPLRLMVPGAETEPPFLAALVLRAEVERATEGGLSVEILPAAAPCATPVACLDLLGAGGLDLLVLPPAALAARFPAAGLLDLPCLLPDAGTAAAAAPALAALLRPALLEASGGALRLLALGPAGTPRGIALVEAPLAGPEDLAGRRIAVLGDARALALLAAHGAEALRLPRAEVGRALETGALDGVEASLEDILALRIAMSGVKFFAETGHRRPLALWLMREARFAALAPPEAEALSAGIAAAMRVAAAAPLQRSVESAAALAAFGGEVRRLPAEGLQALCAPAGGLQEAFRAEVPEAGPLLDAARAAVTAAAALEVAARRLSD